MQADAPIAHQSAELKLRREIKYESNSLEDKLERALLMEVRGLTELQWLMISAKDH